jgi:hypothetical protein
MTTTFEELEEIEVPPGHGLMHKATRADGDLRTMWDKNNPDEVAAARRTFDDLVGSKKYNAFLAEGKKGDLGKRLDTFDPDAERIILVKRLVAG